MAAVTGCNGKVLVGASTVAIINSWSFNPTVNIDKFGHSGSGCWKDAVAGTKDGSGSFDAKLDTADEFYDVFEVGDAVTLKLYITATLFYTVQALIEGYTIEVDIDDGNATTVSVDFQAKGNSTTAAWVKP